MKRTSLALILALALAGCSNPPEPRFDGSSEEAFQSSLALVAEGLSQEELAELGEAVMAVTMWSLLSQSVSAQRPEDVSLSNPFMALDGKSREDVLALAEQIREEYRSQGMQD